MVKSLIGLVAVTIGVAVGQVFDYYVLGNPMYLESTESYMTLGLLGMILAHVVLKND